MIINCTPLLSDPRIDLTSPPQLLSLLTALPSPLFILFTPSESDSSPPDPATNWGGNHAHTDAFEFVNAEFSKGDQKRYLAVVDVGSYSDWINPNNYIKKKWGLKSCPILYRLSAANGKITHSTYKEFTRFLSTPIKLFKKGPTLALTTDFTHFKLSHYNIQTSSGQPWTGVDAEPDLGAQEAHDRNARYLNNLYARHKTGLARLQFEMFKEFEEMEVERKQDLKDRGMDLEYEPSVVEENGRILRRVETLGSLSSSYSGAVVKGEEGRNMVVEDPPIKWRRWVEEIPKTRKVEEKPVERVDDDRAWSVVGSKVDEEEEEDKEDKEELWRPGRRFRMD